MAAATQNQQTKSFWLGHVEQWQLTGLSQAAYCRQHDLCEQKFSYRKRQSSFAKDTDNSLTGFTRVQIDSSISSTVSASDAGAQLSLRLSCGICVEGITEDNLVLIPQLVSILQ